jgi:hypothetical protein
VDIQPVDPDEKAFLTQPGPLAAGTGVKIHVFFHLFPDDLRIGFPVSPF